jgi:hypothetical protein
MEFRRLGFTINKAVVVVVATAAAVKVRLRYVETTNRIYY